MVNMQLGAFNVLVCDQKSNMADIKIQGENTFFFGNVLVYYNIKVNELLLLF